MPYWKINEGLWNAYFWIDDARALFAEIKTRGAKIDYELCQQPYERPRIRDPGPGRPDIGFGQELNPSLKQNSKA